MHSHADNTRQRILRSERGVTLVELMFGLVIGLVLIGAGYSVLQSSEKAMTVNDQTSEMQQNARIAMELVSRDLKMAGFGMTSAVGNCGTAIVPADNNPGGADTGPDSFSVVVPTQLSTLAAQARGTVATVTLQSGAVAAMVPDGFGTNSVISVGGVHMSVVSNISGDVLTLSTQIGSPAVYPVGTQVYWLRCITYDIVRTTTANATTLCSGLAPCLRRGVSPSATTMVPVAEGIEDIQVAYACDGCATSVADGVVDDQNASGTFDTSDFVSNSSWNTSPMTADTIRLARVSIVARQTRSDPQWTQSAPQVVEDHNPTQDTGFNSTAYSQIRRRVFTRTIQLRNVGLAS